MGIPLRVEPLTHTDPPLVGYRIDRKEYEGQPPNLAPDELAALYVAASLVRLHGVEADGAFWKIGGRPDIARSQPDQPLAALPTEASLAPLFRAASELRRAQFSYRGQLRDVDPHRLSFSGGHWYLDAFDRTRNDQRLFRIDRIEGDVTLGEPGAFERPTAEPRAPVLRAWELGDGQAVEARVLIDAEQSDWASAHLGDGALVETRADGSREFAFSVRNIDAFRSFVLTFLEHGEILSPPEFRRDLIGWLEGLAR